VKVRYKGFLLPEEAQLGTFPYENASAERFQQFCQALLITEYPGLACLPVGQRDGGRDGVQIQGSTRTILQVKWKRHDEPLHDTASWMISTLEKEKSKIEDLISAGATHYVIATNARGTSYPESGSIDRVQAWLDEEVSIHGQCLWRDDLDRRLENNINLQWHYPELLSGPNALRLAFETSAKGDSKKRARAIGGYILKQYELDKEVRFKQVSLKNDLFPLFIDVPVHIQPRGKSGKQRQEELNELIHSLLSSNRIQPPPGFHSAGSAQKFFFLNESGYYTHSQTFPIGAVDLLSQCDVDKLKRVVIEGAPGQGKSTLAQYFCQMHRCRFLGYVDQLESLPESHRTGTARLPFKIDLRDLSAWLEGRNPFKSSGATEDLPAGWEPSLEAFLVYQIHRLSGYHPFDVSDLSETLEAAPVALFFDGLDEVAGVAPRRRLIEETTQGKPSA
jgi:hypothetical protein